MPIPKIISVCSKCKIKSNTCRLVQYNESMDYSIICSNCFTTDNENGINIINYNGKDTLVDKDCIENYKINCQKCFSYIKHKTIRLAYQAIKYFRSIKCSKNSNDDTIKLHEIV